MNQNLFETWYAQSQQNMRLNFLQSSVFIFIRWRWGVIINHN